MKMRALLRFGLLVWALTAEAQQTATLWIRLDEAGKQDAFIVGQWQSDRLGDALAKAMGCQPRDLAAERMQVKCDAPVSRNGLT